MDSADGWHPVAFVEAASAPTWDLSRAAPRVASPTPGTRVRAAPWPMPTPPADWRTDVAPAARQGLGLELCLVRPPRLIGRDGLRDALWAELVLVHATRRPRVVLLRGPSGVGKSRLADWLAERADELGAATAYRAHHQEIPGPLDGLGPMLDRALRTVGVSQLVLADELELELGLDASTAAELAEVLRGPIDRFQPLLQTDAARWDHVLRVLGRTGRPAVVVLDDVPWAPSSLGFCEHLLARGASATLVVATIRDEDLARRPRPAERLVALARRADVVPIDVEPLGEADARRLVDELLPLEPDLAARLHRRTAGNPLFQVHLVGDWVRRGLLEPGPGGLRVPPGTTLSLPAELATMWRGRVDELLRDLGPQMQRPLELAAALGHQVVESEWVELVDPTAAGRLARELRARGLAHAETVGTWSWAHAMVREAVLERAGSRRPKLHADCAGLLAFKPTRQAPHLVAAGRYLEGAITFLRATEELRSTGSSGQLLDAGYQALRALEAAGVSLDDPLWPRLRVKVGMEQLNRNALPYVDEQLELARPHLERPSWEPYVASFHLMEAWLAGRRGDSSALGVSLDRVLVALPSSGQKISVAATAAYYLRRVGRLPQALEILDELLPLDALAGDEPGLGMVAQVRGTLELGRGDLDLARRYLEYGLKSGLHAREVRVTLACHGALGSLARAQGQYDQAVEHYQATSRIQARLGIPNHVTDANLAVLDVVQGRPIQAAERFARLIPVQGLPAVLQVGAQLGVLLGWLAQGARGDAPADIDAALERLASTGQEPELQLLATALADAADAAGRGDLAAKARRTLPA